MGILPMKVHPCGMAVPAIGGGMGILPMIFSGMGILPMNIHPCGMAVPAMIFHGRDARATGLGLTCGMAILAMFTHGGTPVPPF